MSAAFDVHLTPGQRDLYDETQALARTTLKPIADSGRPGRVNRRLVKALADHGLLPRLFSDSGQISAIELCLIREALARECADAETAFGVQGLGAYPIVQNGTQQLQDEWIPQVANGTAIAAFALTEPEAGSDPRAITLRAEPDGTNGYRLSGEKLWISNAPEADIYTVFARTKASPRLRSKATQTG